KTQDEELCLLEESFALLSQQGVAVVERFYDTLFHLHPETKVLFRETDLSEQSKKLWNSLQLVIRHLRKPAILEPVLQELGRKHAREYQVEPEHYVAVGESLLVTFAEVLGNQW